MPFEGDVYVPCWEMEPSDVWNFDETLARFIADGLEMLAANSHTYVEELGEGGWEIKLVEVAGLFRTYQRELFQHIPEQKAAESLKPAWEFFGTYYGALWD